MCIAYIRSRQVLSGAYEPQSLFVKSYDHALVQSYDYSGGSKSCTEL